MVTCWICGYEGNSGEHFVKASDIKLYFGDFDQKRPLYVSRAGKLNVPIGSKKSNQVKSNALLCKRCNNELTQSHDFAWEKLSHYIVAKWKLINKNNKIDLKKVFPGASSKNAVSLQLYFLKLLGCALNEQPRLGFEGDFVSTPDKNPENLKSTEMLKYKLSQEFSKNILEEKLNNNVYLNFFKTSSTDLVGVSNLYIDTDKFRNALARTVLFYFNKKIVIRILYIHPANYDLERPMGWNPSEKSKILKVK